MRKCVVWRLNCLPSVMYRMRERDEESVAYLKIISLILSRSENAQKLQSSTLGKARKWYCLLFVLIFLNGVGHLELLENFDLFYLIWLRSIGQD